MYTGFGFRPTRWQQRWEGGVEAVAAMTGAETLDASSANILARNPNGANRVLTLNAEADADGLMYWIRNAGTGGFTLDVQDDAGASVILLRNGESALVACNGTTWEPYIADQRPEVIADPGDGNAIPVTASGSVAMTSAGVETRTIAIPTFVGQRISLFHSVDGGSIAVTAASGINQAADTVMTFTEVEDFISLEGADLAGTLVWRVVANDGVVLS